MASLNRVKDARRLVVKIGSALLVDAKTGALRLDWLQGLAADIAALRRRARDVLVVSSGSIALGRRVLELPTGALSLEQSQAAAAVGQIRLARAYQEALSPFDISTAQVLLTLADTENRRRYLNSRATLATLLGLGVVPIVNENDTVATDEIRYGDNDRLAAQVAGMAVADLLVLLSDVDGLYTANPKVDARAQHLARIEAVTPEIEALGGAPINSASRGGMKTMLIAARSATAAGVAMVIARGDISRPLTALEQGARHSWFQPTEDPHAARKRWIAGMKPRGELIVDAGAAAALNSGKSLLPAGVAEIAGQFQRGDPVAILGKTGARIGKGLVGYDSTEARLILGHKSGEIETILGHPGRAALIHRDDMVM